LVSILRTDPVTSALFENIKGDATIGELLSWFSDVRRSQLEAVLEHGGQSFEEA